MIKWAYAKAQKDIKKFGGNNRFDTKPPESKAQLQAKINAINDYLDAPTRTKTGVRKIFVEKANTINEKYGTSYKWNEIGEFFESVNREEAKEEAEWQKARNEYLKTCGTWM